MRVGVLGNPDYRRLDGVLERLDRSARELGFDLYHEDELRARAGRSAGGLAAAWDELDWLLTLGGDGTFLRGARLAGPRGIPVLGCNLGRLGFLTVVAEDDLEAALRKVAEGRVQEERRLALEVRVGRRGGVDADGDVFYSVNDAVIHKSGFARMIRLRLRADEEEVGQYSADGIIVSTATGSTAYSLSAGGPILAPGLDAIVATPISPHTLAVRPVVLPAGTQVSVELLSASEDVALTVDGQVGSALTCNDRVVIERSEHPVRLLHFPGHSFFSVLRRKLRWGDVRPRDA